MRWYQFDFAGIVIRSLEKVGLVTNVWRVPRARFEAELRRAAEVRSGAPLSRPAPVTVAPAAAGEPSAG
jgi:hypothetical protein